MTTIEPASAEEVGAVLTRAAREGRRVWIRGGGSKHDWGPIAAVSDADVVLSTAGLSAVVAHRHGDLTATVQAGATLGDVNRALARHRQWIPLDPPWPERATIGGIVATNDSGPRRHRYGAPRDLIIGVDLVRADGTAAKAGGIVVKNVAGYDLARLVTGSFGSLAVVVSATFKLYPLAPASRTAVIDYAAPGDTARTSAERLGALVARLLESQLTPSAVEVQQPPGRLLVRFETIDVAADQQAAAVDAMAAPLGARASVVQSDEEQALWTDHGRRPWNGDGAIVKITVLPTAVAQTVEWLANTARDHDVIGRACVGVLLARIGGDVDAQARVLVALRGRIAPGQGSAVLVRGPADLKSRVDVWGSIGDGLAMMRAVKRQFDPDGRLNPGRGPGGI